MRPQYDIRNSHINYASSLKNISELLRYAGNKSNNLKCI